MTNSESYFAHDWKTDVEHGDATWFDLKEGVKPFEMLPGLTFRPALGQGLMVNLVSFEPNTEAPLHAHSEEQIAFVLEGEFEFEVNGVKNLLKPGQAVLIPPHAPHAARTFDSTCVELDIFTPPRQGLLDAMKGQSD